MENQKVNPRKLLLQKPFIKFFAKFIFPIIIAFIANSIEGSIYGSSHHKVFSKVYKMRMEKLFNAFNQGVDDISQGKKSGEGLINDMHQSQTGEDLEKEQKRLWSEWEKNNKLLIFFHKYHISAIILFFSSLILMQKLYKKRLDIPS